MRDSAEIDGTAKQNVVHFGVASNIAKLRDSGGGVGGGFLLQTLLFKTTPIHTSWANN
jgi:hypothetical protein